MDLVNEEFKKKVAIRDNEVHFIRAAYRAGTNVVPILIMIAPDRIGGYVLATAPNPIPEELRESAHDLARLSCLAAPPEVIFDSDTGGCAAFMPLDVRAVAADEIPLDFLVARTAERLGGVCRRVE